MPPKLFPTIRSYDQRSMFAPPPATVHRPRHENVSASRLQILPLSLRLASAICRSTFPSLRSASASALRRRRPGLLYPSHPPALTPLRWIRPWLTPLLRPWSFPFLPPPCSSGSQNPRSVASVRPVLRASPPTGVACIGAFASVLYGGGSPADPPRAAAARPACLPLGLA